MRRIRADRARAVAGQRVPWLDARRTTPYLGAREQVQPGPGRGPPPSPGARGGPLPNAPSRVTEILLHFDPSDPAQANELFVLVYDDLREIAGRQLARERQGHTLQPTALVHEAYLRLFQGPRMEWRDRAHFFRIAARAMRQVLVDAARRRKAERRGGDPQRVTLDPDLIGDEAAADHDVLALHDALDRLGRLDAALERLIELRFFTGLTLDEAAQALGVSRRKAANDWAAARLWLRRELLAS